MARNSAHETRMWNSVVLGVTIFMYLFTMAVY